MAHCLFQNQTIQLLPEGTKSEIVGLFDSQKVCKLFIIWWSNSQLLQLVIG